MRTGRFLTELLRTTTRAYSTTGNLAKAVEPVRAPVVTNPEPVEAPNAAAVTYKPGIFNQNDGWWPEQLGPEDNNKVIWTKNFSRNDIYE